MGLTLKRIGFGALALAAVALPLRKEHSPGTMQSTTTPALRLDSLYWQRRAAHLSWSAFDLRDSAMRTVATAHAGGARPAVAFRGFASVTSNAEADSIITTLWSQIGHTNPNVTVSALIYNTRTYAQPSYIGALITRHDDRTECVAISPAGFERNGQVTLWRQDLAEALAPCTLLAMFGAPGTGVAGWLSATGYAAAQSNLWLVPRKVQLTRGPWIEWDETGAGRRWPDDIFGWMQSIGLFELAVTMRPPYVYGASGLRCINGDQAACVAGVLHSAIALPAADSMPPDVTLSAWLTHPKVTTVATIRPPSPEFVAALITEFGRERFQKFWAADRSFEAAFQDAFGESLGTWTAGWAAREWRGTYEAQHLNADILLGVTLKPSWLPLTIGWTLVALLVAGWVARRRTA